MSLTLSYGPLAAGRTSEVNYRIDGPEHLMLFDEFPRRVRASFSGQTVADTRRGRLLHEIGLLPVLYIPDPDVAADLLHHTDHRTHCPFKGDAAYWSVQVGGATAEDAVWAYRNPTPSAEWLRGYKAIDWDAMDAWYDENEQVRGHLRDPYHRVDVRATHQRVRVLADEELLAESTHAKVLSETGLPNRYYVPREDVHVTLRPSDTTAVCPYKGHSSYWSSDALKDLAWSYEDPLEDGLKIAGHLSFRHERVTTEIE